jgi:Zn-dependent protease
MRKPIIVSPDEKGVEVGQIFSASLVVKGITWIPLTPFLAWPIMAGVAKRRIPERSWMASFGIGALTVPIILGSEWCHNLAHAAAAKLVRKPMDAIRIMWGMPRLIYDDINDQEVSPKQHILRSLGGPLFNLVLLPFTFLLKKLSRSESPARDVADAALWTNALIPAVGLLPIPALDGGPILKWSLVKRGHQIEEADQAVRQVNVGTGSVLALAGAISIKKRRKFLGGLLITLGAAALGFGLGILKEQE